MVLPSNYYRDPMEVAMRTEAETNRKEQACGDCRERVSLHWRGEEIANCSRKYQEYGRRCEHYRKKGGDNAVQER